MVLPAPGVADTRKSRPVCWLYFSMASFCHPRSVVTYDPFRRLHLGQSACPLVTSVGPPATYGCSWSACHPGASSTPQPSQHPSAARNSAARSRALNRRRSLTCSAPLSPSPASRSTPPASAASRHGHGRGSAARTAGSRGTCTGTAPGPACRRASTPRLVASCLTPGLVALPCPHPLVLAVDRQARLAHLLPARPVAFGGGDGAARTQPALRLLPPSDQDRSGQVDRHVRPSEDGQVGSLVRRERVDGPAHVGRVLVTDADGHLHADPGQPRCPFVSRLGRHGAPTCPTSLPWWSCVVSQCRTRASSAICRPSCLPRG